ncbi:uncharacterized protein BYT42DRAFT_548286 [Radiomyces spectabilis]|uniref:uncharacterized protein n=1 Tax=Radiomyces spectabilis TaxID=64574 RepID=UPI002220FE14|nr:uncharacterized protein BYT42DRAFT_548286 [Radiomyces spectabilis]KAI8371413.1 hypothetical protein BYT42DRAFT_548286 [Radiomyces spectabilis]
MAHASSSSPFRRTSLPFISSNAPFSRHRTSPPSSIKSNSRASSFFLPNTIQEEDMGEDVQADVLFPRFQAKNEDDQLDFAAFGHMVDEHARKQSAGTVRLSRTLSRHSQLYGDPHKHVQAEFEGVARYQVYSSRAVGTPVQSLEQLLNEKGKEALESVLSTTGWWVDALCPTEEEMRVLSKTFHIHPLTTEDILAQEPREKVEPFPNYTFVCFRAFDIDPYSDQVLPYNFYILIFKAGLLTFHFRQSVYPVRVRERTEQLKEFIDVTPDWMNYALIDAVTDGFAPVIQQIEMEAVSIDELSLVLRQSERVDMLKRISRCRRRTTQLARLLSSKLDVLKSLMKRYEDRSRDTLMTDTDLASAEIPIDSSNKRVFSDVLLYLGDIQDHVVTMVQNVNHYDRIFHRAHTNYIAQVNLEMNQVYATTNMVMNRLTFLATVFMPLTLVTGLWGMNVHVPGQDYLDLNYFFWLLAGLVLYCISCGYFGKKSDLL